MIDSTKLHRLHKTQLLDEFSGLVDQDRHSTATLVAYLAEIDRRKLYLEHAYPSMFAFCTKRFRMSEAVAARRIRAGRATCRFPYILGMLARGEVHLRAIHLLAAHLTGENYKEVLRRAKHKTTREVEKLVAELQALLSHQTPDGDPAQILDRGLDALLTETKKKKAAATDRPRQPRTTSKKKNRAVPAHARREVFERGAGQCAFVDTSGRRCGSKWQVEFHHRIPYARGGTHNPDNIEPRCRAHWRWHGRWHGRWRWRQPRRLQRCSCANGSLKWAGSRNFEALGPISLACTGLWHYRAAWSWGTSM